MTTSTTADRLLIVTFDLRNPVPGDRRYRDIDRYLSAIGTMMRPLKQTRLLVTKLSPGQVLLGIRGRIGSRGDAAVFPVSRRSRLSTRDRALGATVAQAIRRHGSP